MKNKIQRLFEEVQKTGTKIIIPTGIVAAGVYDQSQTLALVMTFLLGVITWGDEYRQKRVEEVIDNVGIVNLVALVRKNEKTRDIFRGLLRDIMDESSQTRRNIFYHYINGLVLDIHPDFDEHTKLRNVINDMTLEDLYIFETYNYIFPIYTKDQNNPMSDLERKGLFAEEVVRLEGLYNIDADVLSNKLRRFGQQYDLILLYFDRMNGTMYGATTKFGKIFLDYISTKK